MDTILGLLRGRLKVRGLAWYWRTLFMVNAFDTSSMFPAHPIKYTKRTDV